MQQRVKIASWDSTVEQDRRPAYSARRVVQTRTKIQPQIVPNVLQEPMLAVAKRSVENAYRVRLTVMVALQHHAPNVCQGSTGRKLRVDRPAPVSNVRRAGPTQMKIALLPALLVLHALLAVHGLLPPPNQQAKRNAMQSSSHLHR